MSFVGLKYNFQILLITYIPQLVKQKQITQKQKRQTAQKNSHKKLTTTFSTEKHQHHSSNTETGVYA